MPPDSGGRAGHFPPSGHERHTSTAAPSAGPAPDLNGKGLPDLRGMAAVVMGVSGSGKTVLAQRLSAALGLPYAEADEFHSPECIAAMAGGTALTDEDRLPWLGRLRDWMGRPEQAGGGVVTCSALKRSYRDVLRQAPVRVVFLHVVAAAGPIETRMRSREHFMPAALLPSQLAALEPLGPDEDGVELPNDATLEDLTARALQALRTLTAR